MEKKRYRLIISHSKLKIVPRNWRTFVAYLQADQLVLLMGALQVLELFGLGVEVEQASK